MIAFWIALIPLLFWGAAFVIGRVERRRLPVLRAPAEAPGSAPTVTAVVPARDEEVKVSDCIRSLLGQRYPKLAVVAVDDGSTDRTAEILRSLAAEDPRLSVVEAGLLPEGWRGKCHAIWKGMEGVRSEWLLFTDADTVHHEDLLSAALSFALSRGADAVTLLPHVPCPDFWTRAVNPQVGLFLAALYLPTSERDPRRRRPLVNGQYLLIRREAYEMIGGHRRVRARIVEDLAIGEQLFLYKRKLAHASAADLLTTRMYTGLPELWRGWLKGLYEILGARPLLGLAAAAAVVLTGVVPYGIWVLALGYAGLVASGAAAGADLGLAAVWALAASAPACVLALLTVSDTLRWMRIPARYALAHPVGAAVLAALAATGSVLGAGRRGVTWKGRRLA